MLGYQTVALLENRVDCHSGLGALGSRDNGELHIARGVAHDVNTGHAGSAEMIRLDRALARELASQLLRKIALLLLACHKEYGVAFHVLAARQPNAADLTVCMVDTGDG